MRMQIGSGETFKGGCDFSHILAHAFIAFSSCMHLGIRILARHDIFSGLRVWRLEAQLNRL